MVLKMNDNQDVELSVESKNINDGDEVSKSSVSANVSAESVRDDASSIDPANLHYEGEVCVYTDPVSKYQYAWDKEKYEWIAHTPYNSFSAAQHCSKSLDNTAGKNKDEEEEEEEEDDNDDLKPTAKKEVKSMDMSKGSFGFEDGVHIYRDNSDGSTYFWDQEKSAWFPKVDDDFLARYQMSYGFVDNTTAEKEVPKVIPKKEDQNPKEVETGNKRKAPQEPTWFQVDDDKNTKVYVSNLPEDITEEEFVDLMQKCGLVMKDLDTNKMKIKLYADPKTGLLKGDALCTYIKKESVDLALNVLDGYDIRGKKIKVERAKFTMKGSAYDPSLKPKKKRRKDKEKMKKIQEKLFDWRPEKLRGERAKNEKTVIIKNLFDPKIFDQNVALILEYQQDLREEVAKCGAIKKVIIYDRHPEGVAQINFKEFEAADACIQLINGRWFGQRKITAEPWDGKTKYRVNESAKEVQKRMQNWDKFLEADEEPNSPGSVSTSIKNSNGNSNFDSKEINIESDTDTRSSAGSDYETDDEKDATQKNESEEKSERKNKSEKNSEQKKESEENSGQKNESKENSEQKNESEENSEQKNESEENSKQKNESEENSEQKNES